MQQIGVFSMSMTCRNNKIKINIIFVFSSKGDWNNPVLFGFFAKHEQMTTVLYQEYRKGDSRRWWLWANVLVQYMVQNNLPLLLRYSMLSNVYAYSKWLDVLSRKCKFQVFSKTYFSILLVRKIMFSISFKPLNDGFLEHLVPYVM